MYERGPPARRVSQRDRVTVRDNDARVVPRRCSSSFGHCVCAVVLDHQSEVPDSATAAGIGADRPERAIPRTDEIAWQNGWTHIRVGQSRDRVALCVCGTTSEHHQCDGCNEYDSTLAHVDVSAFRKHLCRRFLHAIQGHNADQTIRHPRTISLVRCCAPELGTNGVRVVRDRSRSRPTPDAVTGIGRLRQRDRSAPNADRRRRG